MRLRSFLAMVCVFSLFAAHARAGITYYYDSPELPADCGCDKDRAEHHESARSVPPVLMAVGAAALTAVIIGVSVSSGKESAAAPNIGTLPPRGVAN